jgi:uncharacterized SAM-binding protein YcdF (DUF218 family)
MAETISQAPGTTKNCLLGGLLVRKYRWGFSFRAKIVLVGVAITLATVGLRGIYPFLAITQPVNTNILVVEGWVHPYAIKAGVNEFKNGSYKRIFTTGGPVVGKGGYVNDFQTSASVGADLLKKAGTPSDLVQMVPSRVIGRDRTFHSAVALRDWLNDHGIRLHSFNIVTEDVHARRTYLLFRKAFGSKVAVGVISVPNPDYDAKHWWRNSEGAQEVLSEFVAYIYASFFFAP